VKRSYSEPRWAAQAGPPSSTRRSPSTGSRSWPVAAPALTAVDPDAARELFIRHALVQREWRTHHRFLADNAELVAEVSGLEDRARRRDLVVDEEALYAFYDARIPADVTTARHFDRWWKEQRQTAPDLLTFTRDLLLDGGVDLRGGFPDVWRHGDLTLQLTYRFAPGAEDDGVTVHVPLAVLNRVRTTGFEWHVPAYREELVTALLRGLPKDWRRALGPIPDIARRLTPQLDPARGDLVDVLAVAVQREVGAPVPPGAFDLDAVPAHLRFSFRVFDGEETVGRSRDLRALQRELAGDARDAIAAAAAGLERSGCAAWEFGDLPRAVTATHRGAEVHGYPAVVDEGGTVGVRVLLDPAEQHVAMWQGTRRLLLLGAPPPIKAVGGRLSNATKLALTRNPHGSVNALLEDCRDAAVVSLLNAHGGPSWEAAGFARLRDAVLADLRLVLLDIVRTVEAVLRAAQAVEDRLDATRSPAAAAAVEDARAHLRALVHPGFVTAIGRRRLPDLVRYLTGIDRRVEKAARDPRRDAALRDRITVVREEHARLLREVGPVTDAIRELRWQIEELRVSLFAQELGTRKGVSEQRILRAIGEAEAAAVAARRAG
jgi:ATP-dependent helicase HrpA